MDPMTTVGGQQVPPLQQRVVGPYQLLAQLGQTATGPVFLARLQHKETLFALKLLPPLGPEELARMRQDSQLLSRVEHPGVVRPIDMNMAQGRAYIVTEHVAGTTLREQLDRKGPMPPRAAARLVADVADALQALHDAGVVHRHLDPSVLVVDGRDGRPKVAELCVARDPRRPPLPGQPPYLPFCMAPEQLRGEKPDARSDVYALGAVLYELLSGSPPFEGQSWSELSQEIQAGDPEPPSDLVAGIPRAIEKACLQALSLGPDDRPTAAELAAKLRAAAGAEGERGGSPVAVAALVVATLAAGGLGVWAWRERDGRLRAEADLTASRADGDGLRAKLDETERARAAQLAEQNAQREQAARKQQELEAALSQARVELTQAKGQVDVARRAVEQRLDALQQTVGTGGGQLQPLVDAVIATSPDPAVRARLLHYRGRVDDLLALVREQRERGPLPPELLFLELRAVQLKDPARLEALARELAAVPPDAAPYGFVTQLLVASDAPIDPAALLQQLKAAAEKHPRDPHLFVIGAQLCADIAGQTQNPQLLQQALALSEQAVLNDPFSPFALLERARLSLDAMQLVQPQQRRDLCLRGLNDARVGRQLADWPDFWLEASRAYLMLGAVDAALGELGEGRRRAQAKQDQGMLARIYGQLGTCKLVMGDEAGAVSAWTDGLRAFPQQRGSYDFLQFMGKLSQNAQRALLQATPPEIRQQLMQRQGQGQGGGQGPGPR